MTEEPMGPVEPEIEALLLMEGDCEVVSIELQVERW